MPAPKEAPSSRRRSWDVSGSGLATRVGTDGGVPEQTEQVHRSRHLGVIDVELVAGDVGQRG